MTLRNLVFSMLLLSILSIPAFGQSPPTNGLVGYWTLDDGSGTVASDSSTSGYDGTLVGNPTWESSGALNGALTLDGVDDAISFTNTTLLSTPNKVTLSAWVKRAPGSGWLSIIDVRDSDNDGYDLYLNNAGRAFFRVNAETVEGFTFLDDGQWHHIAGVYKRDQMTIYVDGLRDTLRTTIPGQTIDVSNDLRIGESYASGINYFGGSLDEIRIYSRGLSPAEVIALYQHGGGVPQPVDITPDAHWSFDDQNDVAADSSGNGFHGTVFGNPTWTAPGTLTFDGNDSIHASAGSPIDAPTELSISAWIDHSNTGLWHSIVDKRDSATDGYDLYINNTGRLFARIGTASTSSLSTVADDTSHLVVMTYDGTQLKLYIDGVLDRSVTVGSVTIDTTSAVVIGERFDFNSSFFDGAMDDVRIFARALKQADILALYPLGF